MAATTRSQPDSGALESPNRPATIPSPAQVQATAAAIRRNWTPKQRRRRAQLACSMLWQQFADAAPVARDPEPNPVPPGSLLK
jgi:hypothetical protein